MAYFTDEPSGQILLSDAAQRYVLRAVLMSHYREHQRHYRHYVTEHLRPLWQVLQRALDGREPAYMVKMHEAIQHTGDNPWQQRVPDRVHQLLEALFLHQDRAGRAWGGAALFDALTAALESEGESWPKEGATAKAPYPAESPSPFVPLRSAAFSYHADVDTPHPVETEAGAELWQYVKGVETLASDPALGLTEFGIAAQWVEDFIHGDASALDIPGQARTHPYDPPMPVTPWTVPLTVWLSLSSLFGAVSPTEPEFPSDIGGPGGHVVWSEDEGVDWGKVMHHAHKILDGQFETILSEFANQNPPRYSRPLQRKIAEDIPLLYTALTTRRRNTGAVADRLRRLADDIGVDYPTPALAAQRRKQRRVKRFRRLLEHHAGSEKRQR